MVLCRFSDPGFPRGFKDIECLQARGFRAAKFSQIYFWAKRAISMGCARKNLEFRFPLGHEQATASRPTAVDPHFD
jgi:hypothetical protein